MVGRDLNGGSDAPERGENSPPTSHFQETDPNWRKSWDKLISIYNYMSHAIPDIPSQVFHLATGVHHILFFILPPAPSRPPPSVSSSSSQVDWSEY
jgi:hypothetical protein